MQARCPILAHRIDPGTFRCPTTTRTFHYHGTDNRQPYRLLVRGAICEHRHQTADAARKCTASNAAR
jgi:hypothetical protein